MIIPSSHLRYGRSVTTVANLAACATPSGGMVGRPPQSASGGGPKSLPCGLAGCLAILLASLILGLNAHAADGRVVLQLSDDGVGVKIDGDKDDDWWVQTSTNLSSWHRMAGFGPLLSGNQTNAPWRLLGEPNHETRFYRAQQTAGLFDPECLRTFNLVYTQTTLAAFTQALVLGRTYETNVYLPRLTLDNGATNHHVGARYKGNTSYTLGGRKKSLNVEFDFVTPGEDLMNYETINLNNAAGDETIMREALYFNIMSQYAPCPRAAMARVQFNGAFWGVYSLVQQYNGQLVKEWFPSNTGDRWRAPNAPVGGFSSSNSAFHYFGNTNIATYTRHYELKSTAGDTNTAWARLINAIRVLNTTPSGQLREVAEEVFALDSWLWFLAIENLFVDDDSYWNKGGDYAFYFEPESGRIHPVEHDGNEAFTATRDLNYTLSPVFGATSNNRPLLYRLLPIGELRQRYLAHLRTVLDEYFNPATLTPMINQFHSLSITSIIADPNKNFTMAAYTNDLIALRTYVTNRHNYLRNHAELLPSRPDILGVAGPLTNVLTTHTPVITAQVVANGNSGVGSVWLYHRGKAYGRFTRVPMFDDGGHGDGAAGDGVFGATVTNYPAGTVVSYYVEARSATVMQAARFAPSRAELVTYHYRVGLATAPESPVILNEFMADNTTTYADPQGEFDDWIELHNLSEQPVSLTGRYLTDDRANPRKWKFPGGTTIPANGFLIVWADNDTDDSPGLHANFALAKSGEAILLIDTDANNNAVMDSIEFGPQQTDVAQGRSPMNPDVWTFMTPTPGAANQ